VSAVVSVSVVAGAYWTVTTQLLAGASVVALQVSSPEGIENALDPVGLKDAVNVVEVPVPALVRVKLWVGVLPEVTDPKS
jgi:ABC-type arginine transport system permease subunit